MKEGSGLIHIRQAIVVEGKYDKIKLSSLVDAVIIVTGGYSIFKDKEKLELIRAFAKRTGVLILTDSDAAGFRIRGYLKGAVSQGDVRHVYIPDLFGKERRKLHPSKEGKLGVEGIPSEVLIEAFEKAGVLHEQAPDKGEGITRLDLYEDGFAGGPDCAAKRAALLERLGLPGRLSTSSMLEVINAMLTPEDYRRLAAQVAAGAAVESNT